jgi:predicted acyltransferase
MTLLLFTGLLAIVTLVAGMGVASLFHSPKYELWTGCFIVMIACIGILVGTQVAQVLK